MRLKLKQIAEIITGYQPRTRVEDDTGVLPFIQQKDIDCKNVNADYFIKIDLPKPQRYILREGDILQVVRGARFSTFLIDKELTGCIFSGQFYRIRLKKPLEVSPEYVFYYINSEAMKKRIKSMARGSGIPLLPKEELANLEIPVPNIETQRNIAELCREAENEKRILNDLISKRAKMISGVFAELKKKSQ